MSEGSEIGEILFVEEEEKSWPFVSTAILIVFGIIVWTLMSKAMLLFTIIIGLCFIAYQINRMASKRVFEFGTNGYLLHYTKFKETTTEVVLYDQVSKPKVNITDKRINGIHQCYIFEVDYGTITFTYTIGRSISNEFEYNSSHMLYRLRNLYLTGNDQDYDDDTWIYLSGGR